MYTSLTALVGQEVTFTPEHGNTHHGTIRSATWNTMGEPVLVIHTDDNPISAGSSHVLIGRDATSVIITLTDHADHAA